MSDKYEWLAKDPEDADRGPRIGMFNELPYLNGDQYISEHGAVSIYASGGPAWLLPGQLYKRGSDDDGKSVYAFDGSLWTLVEDHSGARKTSDTVEHPSHYTSHPSGLECIQVTEHLGFLDGSAIKYIWRHKDKGKPLEDLKKARWYIDRLIAQYEE